MTDMLVAALAYAARGWPVFPCSPENKQPLLPKESETGAKDGGLYLATCDEAQIRKWWARWPRAMIGLPTGQRSGTCVIDLDPKIHAAEAMQFALAQWLGGDSDCALSRTQSGGLHLVFAMPDEKLGNRAGLFRKIADAPEEIAEHVDVRADGGYIIVPPSVMATGAFYEWLREPGESLPPLPPKLADAIAKRLDSREAEPRLKRDGTNDKIRKVPDAVSEAQRKYAAVALDRETSELARLGQGSRGFELNKVAYSLGGLVGAGILSERVAMAAILDACDRNGLSAKDGADKTRGNAERALAAGAAKPIDISQIGAYAGTSRSGTRGARGSARPPDPAPPPSSSPPAPSAAVPESPSSQPGANGGHRLQKGWGDEIHMRCALMPLTDMGNATRFLARFGEDFHYVGEWGWMAWDGKRWNGHDAEAMVQRAVHETIKLIAEEAHMVRLYETLVTNWWNDDPESKENPFLPWPHVDDLVDKKKDKAVFFADKLQGWCLASQSAAHITCMAKIAQHYLTAATDSFDADPMALNVENGTLRFRKRDDGDYVTFHAHDRRDRMTKIAPVAFDPQAQCPLYDRFLARVHPPTENDPEAGVKMLRHLHAWAGVSLTAMQIPKLSFWYGTGRNGKSVLSDTWAFILGDYVQSIPIESFLDQGRARRGGEASPDIAALPGVRMLRTSEPEKRSKLAESMIKLVTGGEPLRARHLNRDFFEFKPCFKLIMQGNYKPSIEGTDEGIWARMMLVPWMVMIPEAERDPLLTEKLKGEASGILNRMLDGLRDYLDHGLSPPDAVRQATQDYREDSDPIGRFLHDCTAPQAGARAPGGELYALYGVWCGFNGEPKWSAKAFKRGLADHGVRAMKSSSMFYLDIVATKTRHSFEGEAFTDEPKEHDR